MRDYCELFEHLCAGDAWRAGETLVDLSETELQALTCRLVERVADRGELLEIVALLVSGPAIPPGTSERDRLMRLDGLKMLAALTAHAALGDGWQDLAHAVRALSTDQSYRVRESTVSLVARIASESFAQSRAFWKECVVEGEGFLVATVLRGLAASTAPPIDVLDLFALVMSDIRKDVRHALGPKAIPSLGRREPREVYIRLRQWARQEEEIARWNVAAALATPLGGAYPEEAMEIIEWLAADERAGVRRAAATAIVQIAQRRPSFVLPILRRWREDPLYAPCARLALETLARR